MSFETDQYLVQPKQIKDRRMYACPLFRKQAVAWQQNVVAWIRRLKESSGTVNGDVRSGKVLPGLQAVRSEEELLGFVVEDIMMFPSTSVGNI
jgi:hypothetical protein